VPRTLLLILQVNRSGSLRRPFMICGKDHAWRAKSSTMCRLPPQLPYTPLSISGAQAHKSTVSTGSVQFYSMEGEYVCPRPCVEEDIPRWLHVAL
jgi:hypothetical protein